MSDPKRLLDGAHQPLLTELLSAGTEEAPSEAAVRRALARVTLAAGAAATLAHSAASHAASSGTAMNAAGAVGAASQGAGAAGAASQGAGAVGAASQGAGAAAGAGKLGVSAAALSKWVGIAAVGVGVGSAAPSAVRWLGPVHETPSAVGAHRAQTPSQPLALPEAPAPVAAAAPVVAREPEGASPQASATFGASRRRAVAQPREPQGASPQAGAAAPGERVEPRGLAPARLPASTPKPPTPTQGTRRQGVLEELRWVDAAREALQAGEPARALDALERYETTFSERQFELEVAVLRMEALARLGRTESARRQARLLLTRSLSERQAARARAVLAAESIE